MVCAGPHHQLCAACAARVYTSNSNVASQVTAYTVLHPANIHVRLVPRLQIAKRQAVVNPENTFFSVKRFIGRKMNEVKDESKQASLHCCSHGSPCGMQGGHHRGATQSQPPLAVSLVCNPNAWQATAITLAERCPNPPLCVLCTRCHCGSCTPTGAVPGG